MKFFAKVKGNKLEFYDKQKLILHLSKLEDKDVLITIDKQIDKRSMKQNNSIHLYFQLLAEALNEAGLDMREVLKKEIDIPWTKETIKEFMWKPIQRARLKKESTTELTTDEIDKVYNILNRFLGEKLKVHIPFPSEEEPIDY